MSRQLPTLDRLTLSSFSLSTTSPLFRPHHRNLPHPILVSVPVPAPYPHPATLDVSSLSRLNLPSSSSSSSSTIFSSPFYLQHIEVNPGAACYSSLFTMAMRYSHYPSCTSPSDCIHDDDDYENGRPTTLVGLVKRDLFYDAGQSSL